MAQTPSNTTTEDMVQTPSNTTTITKPNYKMATRQPG